MALDEPKENETAVTINGLEILLDEQVKVFAGDQVLDYVTSPRGEGFAIKPASGSSCC